MSPKWSRSKSSEEQQLDPHEAAKRKRERFLILGAAVLFALTTYFEIRLSNLSNSLPFVNSIFFFGLINFNVMLLMVLVFLVFRNIGKIFLERRRKILGSRLKTKLVVAFLSFTIIPTVILFLISSLYINSSFDKWFSIKVQNTLQATLEITQTYYKNTSRVAQHLAEQIAADISSQALVSTSGPKLKDYLKKQLETPTMDGIEVYTDPLEERLIDSVQKDPETNLPRLPLDVLTKSFTGTSVSLVQHMGGADLIRAVAPVKKAGKVVATVGVTFIIPVSLVNRIDEVSSVFQDYKDVNPLKYPVKTTYFIILIMMTLLIIFVSIWIGLYLARELTVPLERLVTATHKISEGNLDFEVLNPGNDEIATLTSSFNTMTLELKKHRLELEKKNIEISEKRAYVEALLNSIAAGVISVDSESIITTVNPPVAKLMDLDPEEIAGKKISDVFEPEQYPFVELFTQIQSGQIQPVQKQFSQGDNENFKTLMASASAFGNGVVFVIDDTSYVTKAQREAAWREVARRIAHEIKNPLTPIKLSAQRLQRKFASHPSPEANVFKECTDTIIKNVDELRDMVNEFSNFARFPTATPTPNNLNEALRETVVLYEEAHRAISFVFEQEKRLPLIQFDRDQIKRVMINLLDNAVAALSNESQPAQAGTGNKLEVPTIKIQTFYNEQLKIAVIDLEDNGPGVSDNVKNRMFEPYFSTKSSGTGLGLAIVKRIISDHNGFIRVLSTVGKGTKFTIELPANLLENEYVKTRIQSNSEDDKEDKKQEKDSKNKKWQGLFS